MLGNAGAVVGGNEGRKEERKEGGMGDGGVIQWALFAVLPNLPPTLSTTRPAIYPSPLHYSPVQALKCLPRSPPEGARLLVISCADDMTPAFRAKLQKLVCPPLRDYTPCALHAPSSLLPPPPPCWYVSPSSLLAGRGSALGGSAHDGPAAAADTAGRRVVVGR